MFRRSRMKIVAIIMTVSAILIAGMLGVIYAISYKDMYDSHQEMLERYIENHDERLFDGFLGYDDVRDFVGNSPDGLPLDRPDRRFELSTFYSVHYDEKGNVIEIDNNSGVIYSGQEIVTYAEKILKKGDASGVYEDFSYVIQENEEGCLVAFIDNTIETDNFTTILNYTLIFAGVTLVIIFFLSCYLADKVIKPLEQNAVKQKQFISDAGHELKTPIAVVSTNLEMLSRQIGENKWLNNIEYETEKMSALIKQLMELAKTENLQAPLAEIDMSHLVEGEILVFESVAFEQGILLNYDDVEPEVKVKGNAEQLKQLTAILLDNAIEHTKDKSAVVVNLKKQKSKMVLTVANKGEAIPPEHREHLFERFYRGDYSRNGESNHYGLGLAIAKAITDTHKGSISVKCENGYVIFEVQLPLI